MSAILHDHKTPEWYLECNLDNWVRYMQGMCKPDALPDHASGGFEGYTTYDTDSEGAYEACNLSLALMTDAVICDLPTIEQCAIHHQYLAAVWRFQRAELPKLLGSAREKIQRGLIRKGVWLGG